MLFNIHGILSKKKSAKERLNYRKSENKNQECISCRFIEKKSAGSWSGYKCVKMGTGQSSPDIKINYVCDYFLNGNG